MGDDGSVLDAFGREADALSRAVAGLSDAAWDSPTRCRPWSARDLLGHVCVVIDWLPGMLAAPAPPTPDTSAVGYYRPDTRFSPQTNDARIGLAQDRAARHACGAELAEDFAETWQRVERLCRAEPRGRVVRTRHGDAMLLSEFLLTRVVEVAVHGLDLADAMGIAPWLTPQAGDAVQALLLGADHATVTRELGWGRADFLRRATGRESLDEAESARVERLGIRWLTLG